MSDPTGITPDTFTLYGFLLYLHESREGEYGLGWGEFTLGLEWTLERASVALISLVRLGLVRVTNATVDGLDFEFTKA